MLCTFVKILWKTMSQRYSQTKATLAISKASLKSMFRSPSAVIFSLAFPIIFILVFGFIGDRGGMSFDIAFTEGSNTQNPVYQWMQTDSNIHIHTGTAKELNEQLLKGKLDAMVTMKYGAADSFGMNPLNVTIQTSTASIQSGQIFQSVVKEYVNAISEKTLQYFPRFATLSFPPPVQARVYQSIDFILPGQLGFSMLSAGVFGAAFVFFGLRQTLVLKRFFATPIRRGNIIIGEGISRILFQLMAATLIIIIGHFFFKFTLVNGFITGLEMILLCGLGLIIFMGFGFIVSGIAKNETSIPPFANLITMPQFLLGGTFFSISNFPSWLQVISKAMPLTHLNEALRQIAFDGASLWDVRNEIGIMLLWGVFVYVIAVRVFRWE